MIWMTEKTIQKAVFPLPKTCREARGSEGRSPLMSAPLPAQALGLGLGYRGIQDGPLGEQQTSPAVEDRMSAHMGRGLQGRGLQGWGWWCLCLSYRVCRVDQALTTPRTEKKMTMAKQAYAL